MITRMIDGFRVEMESYPHPDTVAGVATIVGVYDASGEMLHQWDVDGYLLLSHHWVECVKDYLPFSTVDIQLKRMLGDSRDEYKQSLVFVGAE